MKVYRIMDQPDIYIFKKILESSLLKGTATEIDEYEIKVTVDNDEMEELLLRMISEYSVFMVVDRYLQQRFDLFAKSNALNDDDLEKMLTMKPFTDMIYNELLAMLKEQEGVEEYIIKLFPIRTFQVKELFFAIDDWFIENENYDFMETLSEEALGDVERAFSELTLELGRETVYMKNADDAFFSAESLFQECQLTKPSFPELESNETLDKWEKEQLALLLTFFEVLTVSTLHLYKKDEVFFNELLSLMDPETVEEMDIIWHD